MLDMISDMCREQKKLEDRLGMAITSLEHLKVPRIEAPQWLSWLVRVRETSFLWWTKIKDAADAPSEDRPEEPAS